MLGSPPERGAFKTNLLSLPNNMLQIGSLTLPTPFLQAPMAGFSNDAWRRILTRFGGVGLLAAEMMHARGSLEMERRRKTLHGRLFGFPLRSNSQSNEKAKIPLAVQIWDNQPEPLAEFSAKLVSEYAIQAIDLNFGCPAPDVVQKAHCGSWLLQFPDQMFTLAQAVVQSVHEASASLGLPVPLPVTAKMRLGISSDRLTYREAALALESAGVSAVTVHGRTTRQMYSGEADWEKIAEVKSLLKIPVIGNGDLRTARQTVHALKTFGVDGVMIGRAALNEPWIFRQAADLLAGVPEKEALKRPTPEFQRGLLLEHFEALLKAHEETEAVMLMRRFAPCYGVGLKNAKKFRIAVARTNTADEFREVVRDSFPVD